MSDGAKDGTRKEAGSSSGVPAGTSAPTSTASSPGNTNSGPPPTSGTVMKTISQTPIQVAAISPSGQANQSANNLIPTDPATQFRSTLALGQLITAKTPSAGSRIIAGELRQLSNTLKQEGAALRKEISSLHTRLADSLKIVLEEDREQRHASVASATTRRPVQFGSFPYRRFPVYRIPRRVSLALARKSAATAGASSPPRGNASSAGVSNPTAAAAAVAAAMKSAAAAIAADANSVSPASSPENNNSNNSNSRPHDLTAAMKEMVTKSTPTAGGRQNQSTQTRAMKSPHGTPNRSGTVFKNPWFSRDRSSSSYDGEADSDSDED